MDAELCSAVDTATVFCDVPMNGFDGQWES